MVTKGKAKTTAKSTAKAPTKTAAKSAATGKSKVVAKGKKKPAARKSVALASTAGKSLVIVESPAKARTVGQILGRKYVVTASQGHIRDLPKSKTMFATSARALRPGSLPI